MKFLVWCSKYLAIPTLLVIGALVYILFIQENSVGRIYEMDRTIDSLRQAIIVETDSFEMYQELNQRLDHNDPEMVEKVVREQHNMSMPTEEIFVFK